MQSRSSRSVRILALAGMAAFLGASAAPQPARAADPPPGGSVVASISAATVEGQLAFGDGSLWLVSAADTLERVDPDTNTIVASIGIGCCHFHSVAYGDGSVWVSNFFDNTVQRVDPATNAVVATIPTVGLAPNGIAVTPEGVWVADHHGNPTGAVDRIDPSSNTVVASIPLGAPMFCCGPDRVLAAAGSTWVSVPNQFGVARIDPATNTVDGLIHTGTAAPQALDLSSCGSLAYAGNVVWAADGGCNPSHLWRIDPSGNHVAGFVTPGAVPTTLAVGFGSVWVTVRNGVARVDPATGATTGWLSLPKGTPSDVTTGGGSVWVATPGAILRISPA